MVKIQRADQVHETFSINFWYMCTLASALFCHCFLFTDIGSNAGGAPYPTMTNTQICRALKNGYRMERPAMCCDEV